MHPLISIVIPTYSNVDGLTTCLKSIVEYTNLDDTEIIVVANGAPDETKQVLELYRYFPVRLIWIPEAIGYTAATNIGIRAVRPETEYIVLMNDDVVLLSQYRDAWKRILLEPFSDPRMAITGPVKHFCEAAQREFLIFFLVMIRKSVMDDIGILDEIFSPGSGEDTDWTCRAVDAGWKMQQTPPKQGTLVNKETDCTDLPEWKRLKMWTNEFPCYHDGNATFSKIPEIYEPTMQRNHKILQKRYNSSMNTPNGACVECGELKLDDVCIKCSEKSGLVLWRASVIDGWFGADEGKWLAEQVRELPKGARVLELGSWHGRSSRFIADNLPEGGQLWCCDTWNGSSGEDEMHGSAHMERGDHAAQWWWCNLQSHILAGRVVPVRMHSANAAHTLAHLREKSEMPLFDLIFIDASHDYESVKQDIQIWLPLLAEGGIMCGHDFYPEGKDPFAWMGVRQAVLEKFPDAQKAATSIWWTRPHAKKERGRVFDCFLFHNELDVLEIRLATLYDHVDHFVLVEAGETHSGAPKPLHFELNKERFAPYLDKIRHVVIDKFPEFTGNVYDCAWARERYQRDACMLALEDAQPNDVVIIGDADEICSPEAIDGYRLSDGIVRLKQRMFYYYLNCENKEGWDWQKIAPFSDVKKLTPCGVRYPPAGELPLVENGGWHFSFLSATADGVIEKLKSYSHQEFNKPEIVNEEHVRRCRREGLDLFGRDLNYQFVEIDDGFPEYVKRNHNRLFGDMLIHSIVPGEPLLKTDMPALSSRHWTVTASVSTKDRYTTTLPLTLAAIFNQTRLPDRFILYDDSEQRIPAEQLTQRQPFAGLFALATDKGIQWEIQSTPRLGQVANHQHCLDTTDSQFIWRVDDDEVPEPECLETLLNTIRDYEQGGSMERIGAVGGLVHHPGAVGELPQGVDGSLADIALGANLSWFSWNGGVRKVDHLYSTFLLNVEAARAAGGYPRNLSPVGHREESILTHSIKRAGYELLCTPWTKTWHLRDSQGGIRSNPDPAQWEHDEHEWQRLLKTWGVVTPDTKVVVLDVGLGDHFLFLGIFPDLRRKFPERKWVLAVCHPSLFDNYPDVTLISIADAKLLLGAKYDEYSVYRHAWQNNLEKPMAEVMLEFFSQ